MITVVVASPSSSVCTTTAGRGFPRSPGATTRTTSPRLTTNRSDQKPPPTTHRSRRFLDVATAWRLLDGWPRAPSDYASHKPNAARGVTLALADERGEPACV